MFVTQVQPISSFPGLRSDYDRLSFGLALTELASGVLPHDHECEMEFSLMLEALKYVEVHPDPLNAFVWAETRLLQLSGFMPTLLECVVTGEVMQEPTPQLSPMAGGYVSSGAAGRFPDRYRSTFEAVVGLAKVADLPRPPMTMRDAARCALDLLPFWRAAIDRPLPANDVIAQTLRLANLSDKSGT
jgi:DNA repair protein RecO (recombination protein O)